jgi:predicted CoA-binding protein
LQPAPGPVILGPRRTGLADREVIRDFLAQRTLAVVGVSRDRGKYGNIVFRNLRDKGYDVLAVNPRQAEVEGDPCYPSLKDLPRPAGGVVLVVPPAATEAVVREAAGLGIRRVWMQPGAESEEAVQFCRERGIAVVHDACVMVVSRPLGR